MRPVYLTASITNSGLTAPCILDQYLTPSNTLLAVELYGNTGGNYTVQYSPDDPYGSYATDYNTNANWYAHPVLVALSADGVDQLAVPARAVRLLTTTAGSGGTRTPVLTVVQAGVTG